MSVAVLISITDVSSAFTSWLTGTFDFSLLSVLEAILESCGVLQQLVPGLEGQIVSQVVSRVSQGLEAAKNIPRLYRRTNKEVREIALQR